MTSGARNVGASVVARLRGIARERKEDFQFVLLRHANERLLYRLAMSSHRPRFVLKGATLFALWSGHPHRATRDIDLLGYGDPLPESVAAVFREVLAVRVVDDGVRFDASSLTAGPIRDGQAYGGVRVKLSAHIDNAKVRLQVDVGFGDTITPAARQAEMPCLLDLPAPRLAVYPRDTVVAEKVEAMVKLGIANSRMKDFYDLATLSETFDFDGQILVEAIRATFACRGTALPGGLPVALTDEFLMDPAKTTQWRAFLRKSGVVGGRDMAATLGCVKRFVATPLQLSNGGAPCLARWSAGGPWS